MLVGKWIQNYLQRLLWNRHIDMRDHYFKFALYLCVQCEAFVKVLAVLLNNEVKLFSALDLDQFFPFCPGMGPQKYLPGSGFWDNFFLALQAGLNASRA